MDHHLDVVAVGDGEAIVDGGGGGAPVLVQFQAGGPCPDHFLQGLGLRGVALAGEGDVDRKALGRLQHAGEVPGAGGAGGGRGTGGGVPVPPPTNVVMPAAIASSTCCGQMKWMWESMPPAVRILPSPAMISVPGPMMMSMPGCTSGLPALPHLGDAPVEDGDIGFDDALSGR